MQNWEEYWQKFDRLVESLEMTNQINCISELKEAQKYVNGLTDGWFEFLIAFEKSMNKFSHQLSKHQIQQAEYLISSLRNILTNR